MCGENSPRARGQRRGGGSSPRVRGKPPVDRSTSITFGLIPACAGKTAATSLPGPSAAAHPRVCGENTRRSAHQSVGQGSSPRVRGKLVSLVFDDGMTGLIPACAGKTQASPSTCSSPPAHPRVCGENAARSAAMPMRSGSSPRVRGKPGDRGHEGHEGGLIPACAGKTPPPRRSAAAWTAHPRVCGENRGRGRRVVWTRWLIPACAGKTHRLVTGAPRARAHPRVCGENFLSWAPRTALMGSSPRVRGKHANRQCCAHSGRLIPACAGKTIRLRGYRLPA